MAALLLVLVSALAVAQDRVPAEHWLSYADPAAAGFDPARLAAAQAAWRELPSSAFLVVADGAVVAAWGEVDRRFMCHSVRKSFMSALYGIYWDRQKIELNKTLADLSIDEDVDSLLESEKRARILDLLKARSGVFHPAAYAGRTDSQPRGSQGPGRYFAYNNWDFNTLVTILEQETGDKVFQAFDRYFGQPLGMEDWRASDGYYHYELDKSKHPAYPFRLSARDAARFGLLFARGGKWGEERLLSRSWVQRSSALYSIDSDTYGYGLLWWIAREPRFEKYGMFAALGVGNQMIAVLPGCDMVMVNRANTYQGERTPTAGLLDLIEAILEARTGQAASDPELVPLPQAPPDPRYRTVPAQELAEFVGEWPYPPAPLGLPQQTTVDLRIDGGTLISYSPVTGTFREYLQENGHFLEEDSLDTYFSIRDDSGRFAGIAAVDTVCNAAFAALIASDVPLAKARLGVIAGFQSLTGDVAHALVSFFQGQTKAAEAALAKLVKPETAREVEGRINSLGYRLMAADKLDQATQILEVNTRLFPKSANVWDSLGEVHLKRGNHREALRCYRHSLTLNPENANARRMIEQIGSEK